MPHEFVRVCFHRDGLAAEMIRNLLLADGLHPVPIDYAAHVSVAGAEQGYFIEVPSTEVDRAIKVLRRHGLADRIVGE